MSILKTLGDMDSKYILYATIIITTIAGGGYLLHQARAKYPVHDPVALAKAINDAPSVANPCGTDVPKAVEFIRMVGFASQRQPKDAGTILLTCGDGSQKGIRLTY